MRWPSFLRMGSVQEDRGRGSPPPAALRQRTWRVALGSAWPGS